MPKPSSAVSLDILMVSLLYFGNVHAVDVGIVSEFLFSCAVLVQNGLVRPPHGLHGEEAIHAFERDTLRFGNEEEDECDGADHHGREEEIDTASGGTHGIEHLLREAGDNEVPEPVGSRGRRLSKSSCVVVEDLGV